MTRGAVAPALSIIVPCLNEAAGIVAALGRLQRARRHGAEIIIVDGGSVDGTATLAAPFADRSVASPRGRALQMNSGAAIARGRHLLFLHADCALPDGACAAIVDGLAASGRCWGRFDIAIDAAHPALRVVASMMNWRSRFSGIATGDQGIFVTREAFAAAGGFPVLALMEDVAFSRTLKTLGAPLCLRLRITTSARRWRQRGILRTIVLMWRLRIGYFFGAAPARLAARYDDDAR
jgi:rSAM/selenodomain-associated transferase 2